MVDPRLPWSGSDVELEQALHRVQRHVAFPPTPELAAAVRRQLIAPPPSPYRVSLGDRLRPRRLAAAGLVLAIIALGVLSLSSNLRMAIADRLGVGGIEIIFVDESPTPWPTDEPSHVGPSLLLGERLTLEAAQARVPYAIRYPASLGPPDEVYLRQLSAGPMVTLLYLPRTNLPAAAETQVGALLMQFPAGSHPADLAKRVSMGSGHVSAVELASGPGYWLTGATELVIADDPTADFDSDTRRPSANVLIWDADGVTYRLEIDLTKSDAIRLANDLTPAFPAAADIMTPEGTKPT